jgi:hypothetical protein
MSVIVGTFFNLVFCCNGASVHVDCSLRLIDKEHAQGFLTIFKNQSKQGNKKG